jgi:hypothetical protein
MNLVFGSEVALLGFWEYMFRILFRVYSAEFYGFFQKELTLYRNKYREKEEGRPYSFI